MSSESNWNVGGIHRLNTTPKKKDNNFQKQRIHPNEIFAIFSFSLSIIVRVRTGRFSFNFPISIDDDDVSFSLVLLVVIFSMPSSSSSAKYYDHYISCNLEIWNVFS